VRWTVALSLTLAACGRIGFGSAPEDAAVDRGDALIQPGAAVPLGFPAPGIERTPTVAWDGAQFAVAWNDSHGRGGDPSIGGSLVSASLTVQPASLWLGGGFLGGHPPAIACNVSAQCTVVVGFFGSSSGLGHAIVTNGVPTVAGPLVNRASTFPGVASIGTRFLVVYNDEISPSVLSKLLEADGGAATPPNLLLNQLGVAQAATATASSYLAAWELGGQIHYTLLETSGLILRPTVVIAGAADRRPAAASSSTVSLLVWIEMDSQVRAARVAADGALLDTTPLTVSTSSTATRPAVTWDGVAFLVVWEQTPSALDGLLVAAAVNPDTGAVGPVTPLRSAGTLAIDGAPAIASDGAGTSLVAFERAGANPAIYGLLIRR
jgi:hypothetical protein